MVTIDRERLISEKRNNKASAEGARLPKEAMLLRDIYKFTKPSLDGFCSVGLISRACQGKILAVLKPVFRTGISKNLKTAFAYYLMLLLILSTSRSFMLLFWRSTFQKR